MSDKLPPPRDCVNVGLRLSLRARQRPDQVAVVQPLGRDAQGRRQYASVTFQQLDEDSDRIAAGLHAYGVAPGMRLVLLVRPSIDFIALVFALFKAGVVTVLVDPGLGKKNMLACLEQVQPDGFVAIPLAQAVRTIMGRRFRQARFNVTVGRRWFWSGKTLEQIRRLGRRPFEPAATRASDPAAIIFTTGSTGPSKGVLYRHGNFAQQVDEIQAEYRIEPGEVDLPGFPLFALFNAAMGVTTIIPDMDFTRPAQADPRNILEAAHDWQVTQAFGSPALWNVVGRHCESTGQALPTLKRVLSAGAPVPPHVLKRMRQAIHPEGRMHTPYGATEALPVASISDSEVLGETAEKTASGAGTCVGGRFPGIEWQVIRIFDGPLPSIQDVEALPHGEIGELMVRGAVVTSEYVTQVDANALHKVQDGDRFWHRMGDVGYLDDHDRFWYCGRKSHRVRTASGTLFTDPVEAIFNQHPRIYRSALVGVGQPGNQRPVVIVETWPDKACVSAQDQAALKEELLEVARTHPMTAGIHDIRLHPSLPVDIRHNSKIFREKLAVWAAESDRI
ncbi:MAG: fatty acid CoA ligase family protein [Pirellulales bacterium]